MISAHLNVSIRVDWTRRCGTGCCARVRVVSLLVLAVEMRLSLSGILRVQCGRSQRREVCARHGKLGLYGVLRRTVGRSERRELDVFVALHLFLLLDQSPLVNIYLLLQEASRLSVHVEAVRRWWDMAAGKAILWLIRKLLLLLRVVML